MERRARIFAAACIAIVLGAIGASPPAVAAESKVIAQDLVKLRMPGKVNAVLWTRRNDQLTLQVLLQDERPTANRPAENVQIWLLDKSGMLITPNDRRETPRCKRTGHRCRGYEVQYSYPSFVVDEAVAVVLRLGEEVLIEKLERFND
jgi:hypothetical protein